MNLTIRFMHRFMFLLGAGQLTKDLLKLPRPREGEAVRGSNTIGKTFLGTVWISFYTHYIRYLTSDLYTGSCKSWCDHRSILEL